MKLFSLNTINSDNLPFRDRDYYLYFIHLVLREQQHRDLLRTDYVPISSKAVEGILGKKYIQVREYLKQTGFIESDGIYTVGSKDNKKIKGKCYGFRVAEYFRNGHLIYVEAGKKISSRIEAFRKNQIMSEMAKLIQDNLNYLEISKDVFTFIETDYQNDLVNLSTNLDLIKKKYPLKYKVNPETGKRYLSGNNYPERIMHSYDSGKMKATAIIDKDFYCVEDNTAGRVHSNLTNIKKPHRNYLTANGKTLINLDISNSQPFFLAILAKQFYKGNPPKDVRDLLSITSDGMFYEFLMDRMNYTGNRKSFKTSTYANIVFSDTKYKKQRFEFDKIFPSTSPVIDYHKRNDYADLPIKLQQLERHLIIDKIGYAIKDIWFSTIHDSIVVTAGNEELVKSKMENEFKNYCGYIPKINIEYLQAN